MRRDSVLVVLFVLLLTGGGWSCRKSGASLPHSPCCEEGDASFFPVVAWNGPPANHFSDDAFRVLSEAGFNAVVCFVDHDSQNAALLNVASRHGICALLWSPRFERKRSGASLDSIAADLARSFGNSEGFWGVVLRNQPRLNEFHELGRAVAAVKQLVPGSVPYINLSPSYASARLLGAPSYEAYLDSFVTVVRPPVLSFAHFPITKDGLRPDFYLNLELIRQRSLEQGVPFWAAALTRQYAEYPRPKEPYLRFEIYSALAYGAKGIQFFTYWPLPDRTLGPSSAVVDDGGRRTFLYGVVARVNAELHRLGPTLLRLQSRHVYHTPPVPRGGRAVPVNWFVDTGDQRNLLLATFEDPDGRRYLMVVNRDYTSGRIVKLRFAENVRSVREVPRTRLPGDVWAFDSGQESREIELLMQAGDGLLFELSLSRQ